MTQPAHTAACASAACDFPGHPGPAGHIPACQLCPASPTYWRNQEASPPPVAVAPVAGERQQPTGGLDWSKHTADDPQPCRICGKPALMRDADRRPCHKTCAEQAVAAGVQS